MGRHSFSFISQKSRNSDAFRRVGKRYELPGCVGLFESIAIRWPTGAGQCATFGYKSLKNEICAAAYYSNHGKYSFGSAIFEYSRIFEQFVSTLLDSGISEARGAGIICLVRRPIERCAGLRVCP